MREQKGVRGRVIYERYAAIVGDTTFIQGQHWLSRRLPGYPAPQPNCRAKGIADSEDEDPDGERVQCPALVEEEEEGSEEVPPRGGDGGVPDVATTAASAGVVHGAEIGGGAGSSTAAVPPAGRGRVVARTLSPRTPAMPPVSELPHFGSSEIREMIGASWFSGGSTAGSTPASNFDWTQFFAFTPSMQTPRGTVKASPSVGSRRSLSWSLSPSTVTAAR